MVAETRRGIVLVNTGTALEPTPKGARRFIRNFLMSDRIAPINKHIWRFVVSCFIAPWRGRKSAEKYQAIWTDKGSPLTVAHEGIERGLANELRLSGFDDVIVRCAMCYSDPSLDGVLVELREAGCDQLIVLPLFPQSSYSTTGDVHDRLYGSLDQLEWDVPLTFVDNYHDHLTYVQAIAASIKHAGFKVGSDDRLMFAFHSIPLSDVEEGDTYELQVGASALLVANTLYLERDRWTIGYQSRFKDGRNWLAPFSEDVLDRWAEVGVERIFYVCPGFAVDCLETLYDVEYELKPAYYDEFARRGHLFDPEFIYVPCLDKSKAHVTVLYDVVRPYLEEDHCD